MAGEDRAYCAWLIRNQLCVFCLGPRPEVIHHHTSGSTVAPGERPSGKQLGGKRGKGQRAHDHFGMPAHNRCHAKFHQECEESGNERREFQDERVATLRAEYEAEPASKGETVPKPGPRLIAPVPGLLDAFDVEGAASAYLAEYEGRSDPQAHHDLCRVLRAAMRAVKEGRAVA